jgi:hypothetical protein
MVSVKPAVLVPPISALPMLKQASVCRYVLVVETERSTVPV